MTFEGKPSNIAGRLEVKKGDIAEGFAEVEVIIERSFDTCRPVHQGYIEPHSLPRSASLRRQQDHDLEFEPGPVHGARDDGVSQPASRKATSARFRRNRRRLRRQDHRLSRAAGGVAGEKIRPSVKMVMTREEVMRATGPTSGSKSTVKIGGAMKDGFGSSRRKALTIFRPVARFRARRPRRGRLQLCAHRHSPCRFPSDSTWSPTAPR